MKFVPAKTAKLPKTPAKFQFLTPEQVRDYSAELADKIVKLVQGEVVQRLTTAPGELEYTSADGMQVAISAMAAAEGILAVQALQNGLPVEKVREIHDAIFTAVLRKQMPNAG